MSVELTCSNCSTKSSFSVMDASGSSVECPKCGSTIKIDEGGDALSETMRIDLNE